MLAACAGMMSVASVMTVDVSQTGNGLEMDAILALVVGGTSLAGGKFHIGGSVVGALMITTLDKTVTFLGIPSSATPAFKAVVIIILCLLQSGAGAQPPQEACAQDGSTERISESSVAA